MKGDLISKSELLESLNDWIDENTDIKTILRWIEEFEIAYSVEKVVAELEEKALETLGITKAQFQMDKNEYEGYCSLSLYEVKSAIRNGGKE